MGVNLSHYRSSIGTFCARVFMGPKARARSKRRRKEEDIWNDEMSQMYNGNRVLTTLFLFVTVTVFCAFLTTNPIMVEFSKPASSTYVQEMSAQSMSITDCSEFIRISLGIVSVVRCLLVKYGVETNPGPTYRMFLIEKPLSVDSYDSPVHVKCSDGTLKGDFGIMRHHSTIFKEVIAPLVIDC
jgi:hypothetical protein